MTLQQVLNSIQLSKNFKAIEFANTKDGFAYELPDYKLIEGLQLVRDLVGSVNVTSGYRTTAFNRSVGGSANSYHLKGLAADIVFNFAPWNQDTLRALFMRAGFKNVGFYYRQGKLAWIHVDVGTCWGNGNGWRMIGTDYCEKVYNV
jgi:uncharacterized protein YcbK (DUF882 family)